MTLDGYTIRLATEDDIPHLAAIERAAAVLFEPYSGAESGDDLVVEDADLVRAAVADRRLWVCAHGVQVVGFALATILDGEVHLHEIDVLPEHGRRGLGRALVEAVCAGARAAGYGSVTLSTRMDVPFNGPFYGRLGFVALPEAELTAGLRQLRLNEAERGLDVERRAVMRRALA